MLKSNFLRFAAYNQWANTTLLAALAALSPEEWQRDTGAFFGSASGTMNHLLVADGIWMSRFEGRTSPYSRLDEVPFPQFDEFANARNAMDLAIRRHVEGLNDERLAGEFRYTPITDPTPVSLPLAPALSHVFNHQTHHRGQTHMILSVLGKSPPPLDMIYFLRTDEGKAVS
jgi:uncharacterized damage-inducible protein DinB